TVPQPSGMQLPVLDNATKHSSSAFHFPPSALVTLLVVDDAAKQPNSAFRLPPSALTYICPMDPEIRQQGPGTCPKSAMPRAPQTLAPPASRTEWTCPMHPEIVREAPGSCPICGMALEPKIVTSAEEPNHELVDMSRRFWLSLTLSVPLFLMAMSDMLPGQPL